MFHRFHTYQQLEHSDCGLACIRMIARHFGKRVPASYLRSISDPSRLGISVKDIVSIMKAMSITALPCRMDIKKLEDSDFPAPAILYWNQSHFVVLYRVHNDHFYVADPGRGKMRFNKDDFVKLWCQDNPNGIVILCEPTDQFKGRKFGIDNIYHRLWHLVTDIFISNRPRFISIICLMTLLMLGDITIPMIFQHTIDDGINGKDVSLVWILVLSQLLIFIGNFVGNTLVEFIMTRMGLRANLNMMTDYLTKLISLPMSFFDSKVKSDLIQKADDQERIKNFIIGMPQSIFFTTVSILVFSGILIYYNYKIFILFLISVIIGGIWNNLLARRRREIDFAYFNNISENRNTLYELVNGMMEIKTSSAEKIRLSVWIKTQKKIIEVAIKKFSLKALTTGGNNFISYTKDIIVTGYCATLIISGEMTFGIMMTVSYVVGRLSAPFSNIMNAFAEIQDARMSLERVSEITDTKTSDLTSENNVEIGDIKLSDVWFKYPGSSSPFVLSGISMYIPRGSVTAIVGLSGSGKTTLTKLLLSLYPPTQGAIYNNDTNLSDLHSSSWLKSCASVNQNGDIFTGSILSNIALGDEIPDVDRAMDCAKMACIDKFIKTLPMGINTKIGVAGIEVSGGQKQRLLIARAMYKNPQLPVLDEATSSLDAGNEANIIENIRKYSANKSVIIVAHRLSTVKNADNIIFLEDGRIAETGTHTELIFKQGKYFELVSNQLELAVD